MKMEDSSKAMLLLSDCTTLEDFLQRCYISLYGTIHSLSWIILTHGITQIIILEFPDESTLKVTKFISKDLTKSISYKKV
jgi:hypothetical protein